MAQPASYDLYEALQVTFISAHLWTSGSAEEWDVRVLYLIRLDVRTMAFIVCVQLERGMEQECTFRVFRCRITAVMFRENGKKKLKTKHP